LASKGARRAEKFHCKWEGSQFTAVEREGFTREPQHITVPLVHVKGQPLISIMHCRTLTVSLVMEQYSHSLM